MKKLIILNLAIVTTLASCTIENSKTINEKEIQSYLNKLETEYESICINAGKEVWEYYSDSTKNSMSNYKELFSNFILNDSLINNINSWYNKSNEFSNDTVVKRIKLWNSIIICAQVDYDSKILKLQNKLERQISNYPTNNINDDELEQSISKLIKLRNTKARELGYENYAFMILQNSGINIEWFNNLIQTIDSSSKNSYNHFIQKHFPNKSKIDYEDLRPYIYESYMVNEYPAIENNEKENAINKLFANIGIDFNKLPIQFKITDMPPSIEGFNNAVEIPNDFRAAISKELSFYYLIHEIGHGIQCSNVSTNSPILKGYEWFTGNLSDVMSESSAEIIAKFSQNKMWMKRNGYNTKQIDSINTYRKEINPIILRLGLITAMFEIELYKQPEKVPAVIKNELYKKYLYVDKDFSTKPNLIQLSYVSYPIYEQNYLIADIVAWQVHKYLENKYGKNYAFNPEVGKLLKEKLWKNGELYDWQDRIHLLTEKWLDVKGYLKDLLE